MHNPPPPLAWPSLSTLQVVKPFGAVISEDLSFLFMVSLIAITLISGLFEKFMVCYHKSKLTSSCRFFMISWTAYSVRISNPLTFMDPKWSVLRGTWHFSGTLLIFCLIARRDPFTEDRPPCPPLSFLATNWHLPLLRAILLVNYGTILAENIKSRSNDLFLYFEHNCDTSVNYMGDDEVQSLYSFRQI